MAQLISSGYATLQQKLHQEQDAYGSRGFNWGYLVAGISIIEGCHSILDYGCGKGTLTKTLHDAQFDVRSYDPAIPGKSLDPAPADLVAVLDVMEHIEPEYLDAVMGDLVRLTNKILFVVISTSQSKRWMSDGRNTHLIVQESIWWRAKFEKLGFKVRREWKTLYPEWIAMMNAPK